MEICVVGLGYVGLPLAVAFSEKKVNVIGFDINQEKILQYKNNIDVTQEVGNQRLKNSNLNVTSNIEDIKICNVYIVAVPTPVNEDKTPDFTPIIKSTQLLCDVINKGDIIIYESTVYPGVTEDICGKLIEENTKLKSGVDFFLGYSPERINPGDKEHRLENIVKVVSGQDQKTLDVVSKIYESIIEAGIHKASSIKVAEAAKVIENAQRDINIAFVNELSMIFNKMHINTQDVLAAAGTKWNFLNFKPGLVGGHCIGVDPYYLAHCAKKVGYEANVILSGRKINDQMAKTIANEIIGKLKKINKPLNECVVAMCGLTFKENCPDTRNSKVFDIIEELEKHSISILYHDDVADKNELKMEYNIEELSSMDEIMNVDAMVFSVAHDYLKNYEITELSKKFNGNRILFDLKWLFDIKDLEEFDYYQL